MWRGVSPTVLVLVELVEERPHAAVEREAVAHRAQRDHERLVEDPLRGQASALLVLWLSQSAPAPLAVTTTTDSTMIATVIGFTVVIKS